MGEKKLKKKKEKTKPWVGTLDLADKKGPIFFSIWVLPGRRVLLVAWFAASRHAGAFNPLLPVLHFRQGHMHGPQLHHQGSGLAAGEPRLAAVGTGSKPRGNIHSRSLRDQHTCQGGSN